MTTVFEYAEEKCEAGDIEDVIEDLDFDKHAEVVQGCTVYEDNINVRREITQSGTMVDRFGTLIEKDFIEDPDLKDVVEQFQRTASDDPFDIGRMILKPEVVAGNGCEADTVDNDIIENVKEKEPIEDVISNLFSIVRWRGGSSGCALGHHSHDQDSIPVFDVCCWDWDTMSTVVESEEEKYEVRGIEDFEKHDEVVQGCTAYEDNINGRREITQSDTMVDRFGTLIEKDLIEDADLKDVVEQFQRTASDDPFEIARMISKPEVVGGNMCQSDTMDNDIENVFEKEPIEDVGIENDVVEESERAPGSEDDTMTTVLESAEETYEVKDIEDVIEDLDFEKHDEVVQGCTVLEDNINVHTGEIPHHCLDCEKFLTQASHLATHKRVHTGEKSHECPASGKWFARAASSLARRRRLHGGEKPYECAACDKSFSYRSLLERHGMIHTGEKLHVLDSPRSLPLLVLCVVCLAAAERSPHPSLSWPGRVFRACLLFVPARSSSPYFVRRVYALRVLLTNVLCVTSLFFRSSHLGRHRKVHTGEVAHHCPDCEKSLTQASHLATHRRVHTGEKSHGCFDSGKWFARAASSWARRRRLHGGEKPYECAACNKSFSCRSLLEHHRMIHIAEKLRDFP
ncbi:unnamed protein product [Cyprideis torosa]|uniref:Uncharacterized protein n=1 Tax=Cyprideis torosa TaxID=163714 RepID=A0A7R8WCE3_9CRUS|nr:unnamed protein product [Cyprideis torosa]CAG0893277.1 unnamed protein product [Cyprideis torosa]